MEFSSKILASFIVIWFGLATTYAQTNLEEIRQHFVLGELDKALYKTEELLKKQPKNIEARFYRGILLSRTNQMAAAEAEFQSLIVEHPELPAPYNNLAVVYFAQGRYEEAKELLDRVISDHPNYSTAYENLGDVYAKMADKAYRDALSLNSDNPGVTGKLSVLSNLFLGPMENETAPSTSEEVQTGDDAAVEPELKEISPGDEQDDVSSSETPSEPEAATNTEDSIAAVDLTPMPVDVNAKSQRYMETDVSVKTDEIVSTLEGWAKAWSNRDADEYLSFYDDSFDPIGEITVDEWRAQRRERLVAKKYIDVRISAPRVTLHSDYVAEATFTQNYQSDVFNDQVRKKIWFKRSGERWLITRERALN